MHARYLALRAIRPGGLYACHHFACLVAHMFSRAAATVAGLSGSVKLARGRVLLSCTGKRHKTEPAVSSFDFGISRTGSTDFFYPEHRDEDQFVSHNGSGHTSPAISECSSCSEAATIVCESTSVTQNELSSDEEAAKAASRLRSACQIFNVSAGRDGGCFDLRAACGATAILRLSSGSVLFTRLAAPLTCSEFSTTTSKTLSRSSAFFVSSCSSTHCRVTGTKESRI